jgi:hypothetical protein
MVRLAAAGVALTAAAIDPDKALAARGPGHEGRNHVEVGDMAIVAAVLGGMADIERDLVRSRPTAAAAPRPGARA